MDRPHSMLDKMDKSYHAPETTQELEWAQLATLDLSLFDQPGGRDTLVRQLAQAVKDVGFFYLVNFGLTEDQISRQFAIGKTFFDTSLQEKLIYRADLENGSNFGYTPLGIREISPGAFNNWEVLNLPKFIPAYDPTRPRPEVVSQHHTEIEHFAHHIHHQILTKLLTLLALTLDLPDHTFLQTHHYNAKSNCHLRYMKYHAATAPASSASDTTWFKGHTDFGSLTLNFSQPVSALQIRLADATWKWVRPLPNSITVNIGDTLDLVTKGYLRSSIHRVVAPPSDQRCWDRYCLMYFARPDDEAVLEAVGSPVIERAGCRGQVGLERGFTTEEWVRERVRRGRGKVQSEQVREEILDGVEVKYYG